MQGTDGGIRNQSLEKLLKPHQEKSPDQEYSLVTGSGETRHIYGVNKPPHMFWDSVQHLPKVD